MCCSYACICATCVPDVSGSQKKIIRIPENIIKDGFEPLYGYYELNPGLFQEHPLLLDAKQSNHPRKTFLHKCAHVCMYACMFVCVFMCEYIN